MSQLYYNVVSLSVDEVATQERGSLHRRYGCTLHSI